MATELSEEGNRPLNPWLEDMQRKSAWVTIRMTHSDMARLKDEAGEAGITVTELIRRRLDSACLLSELREARLQQQKLWLLTAQNEEERLAILKACQEFVS